MKSTEWEQGQLIPAIRMWFARNGGAVDVKVKEVAVQHNHHEVTSIMPTGFGKVKVLPEFLNGSS